jgi:NAD(P)-dependent dehydrogenase (short-subunit alcohol dehydrogenase family)
VSAYRDARFLRGRHAVVTGGGRGIGAAIARALSGAGAEVTLMGRDLQALETVAGELRAAGGAAHIEACDVSDAGSVRDAFDAVRDRAGAIYALVNNAGQSEGAPFLETRLELWDRMLAVNLTGTFLCTQQVLRGMLEAGTGRIVNIASTSGLRGYRNIAAYAASKHGVVGLTRALAAETARAGITVNAVCPAYTDTAMTERAVATVARDFERTEAEARAAIERTIARGTLIRPEEVADAVLWLCSPDAGAVTGQAIAVAGGEI